jgi:hypothetical protein
MRAFLIVVLSALVWYPRFAVAREGGGATEFQVPDSARLVSLSEQLRAKNTVRVETRDDERLELHGASVTDEGVTYRRAVASSGIASRDFANADAEAGRIGWDRIRSIEAPGHGARNGAVVGLALGIVAGAMADAAAPCKDDFMFTCEEARAMALPVFMALGGGLGALTGAAVGHSQSWRRVYP